MEFFWENTQLKSLSKPETQTRPLCDSRSTASLQKYLAQNRGADLDSPLWKRKQMGMWGMLRASDPWVTDRYFFSSLMNLSFHLWGIRELHSDENSMTCYFRNNIIKNTIHAVWILIRECLEITGWAGFETCLTYFYRYCKNRQGSHAFTASVKMNKDATFLKCSLPATREAVREYARKFLEILSGRRSVIDEAEYELALFPAFNIWSNPCLCIR